MMLMKHSLILCFIFFYSYTAFAQFEQKMLKDIKPDEAYSNVKVIPVYNDPNISAFVIFVKNDVPKHYHNTHTETIVVLEGRGEMYLDGEIFPIKKGDQVIIPQGLHHAVVVKSKKPLKVLSIQSPYFENKDRFWVDEE